MTALLDAPVGTLDVSRLEERQPDVPLTCTRGGEPDPQAPCGKVAQWEALCMTCGHVFRRCAEHFQEDVADAAAWGGECGGCATCFTYGRWTVIYLDQYVRIGA